MSNCQVGVWFEASYHIIPRYDTMASVINLQNLLAFLAFSKLFSALFYY